MVRLERAAGVRIIFWRNTFGGAHEARWDALGRELDAHFGAHTGRALHPDHIEYLRCKLFGGPVRVLHLRSRYLYIFGLYFRTAPERVYRSVRIIGRIQLHNPMLDDRMPRAHHCARGSPTLSLSLSRSRAPQRARLSLSARLVSLLAAPLLSARRPFSVSSRFGPRLPPPASLS